MCHGVTAWQMARGSKGGICCRTEDVVRQSTQHRTQIILHLPEPYRNFEEIVDELTERYGAQFNELESTYALLKRWLRTVMGPTNPGGG